MANHFSQGLFVDLLADPRASTSHVSPGELLTLVLMQTDQVLHIEKKSRPITSYLTSTHLHNTVLSCPLQKLSPQMQITGLISEVPTSSLALWELREKQKHFSKDAW